MQDLSVGKQLLRRKGKTTLFKFAPKVLLLADQMIGRVDGAILFVQLIAVRTTIDILVD